MSQQFQPGTTILGRYVIDRMIGQGGMGSVYLAHHAELARKRFAVKTLRRDVFGVEDVEARFRREAEVLSGISHPGIVSLVDFGMFEGTPVMVMEFLEGETLRDRLMRERQLPLAETVRIVREVAAALDTTHRADPPVIHRDLKPENLFLVAPDQRLKLLDFGIAKVVSPGMSLTQAATALGTPQYMSPEQLRDSAKVEPSADIFALASIAYECLAGALAFPGDGIAGVVMAIFDRPRPRVAARRNDVPPGVDSVLARAWSIEPAHRYASAGEFARTLEAAAGGAAMPAASPMPTPFAGSVPSTWAADGGARGAPGTPPRDTALDSARASTPSGAARRKGDPAGTTALFIGGAIAVIAILAGIAFAWSHSGVATPAPVSPASAPSDAAVARPGELTIGAGTANAHEGAGALAGGADVVDAGPPRTAFDVVHDALESPVRACGAGLIGGRRIGARITWNGRLGFPLNVTLDHHVTANISECISRVVATYGRIPPQSEPTVTRQMSFTLQ